VGYNFLYPSSNIESYIRFCEKQGLIISKEFLICAEEHLKNDFEKKCAIKLNKHLSIAPPLKNQVTYIKNQVSEINLNLGVNHKSINVTIKWSSHSKRIYQLHDKDINCLDVFFWFDSLDIAMLYKYLYPKVSLPFKLKDLSYELVVTRINMDCTINIQLKQELNSESIIKSIDDFIADFNEKSEKKDRKDGVIHNWKREFVESKLIYELDLGSTGAIFLKKLLTYFSKLKVFVKIELC
jgi:hypothetical protein